MQYFQGNLALDNKHNKRTERVVEPAPKPPVSKQQTAPMPAIPVGVKLKRLASVLFVVCVLVFLMGRYTQIYQYNLDIRDMNRDFTEIQAENSALRQQSETMKSPERLKAKAEEWGFVPPTQEKSTQLASSKTGKNAGQAGANKSAGQTAAGKNASQTAAGKDNGQTAVAKR